MNKGRVLIPYLPLPLGPNRIEECWKIWTSGIGNIPALKAVYEKTEEYTRHGVKLFGSRKAGNKTRQSAGYVRLICVAIELLEGRLGIGEIQDGVVSHNIFISNLGKHIATIFRTMGVSNGKTITTSKSHAYSTTHWMHERNRIGQRPPQLPEQWSRHTREGHARIVRS